MIILNFTTSHSIPLISLKRDYFDVTQKCLCLPERNYPPYHVMNSCGLHTVRRFVGKYVIYSKL